MQRFSRIPKTILQAVNASDLYLRYGEVPTKHTELILRREYTANVLEKHIMPIPHDVTTKEGLTSWNDRMLTVHATSTLAANMSESSDAFFFAALQLQPESRKPWVQFLASCVEYNVSI